MAAVEQRQSLNSLAAPSNDDQSTVDQQINRLAVIETSDSSDPPTSAPAPPADAVTPSPVQPNDGPTAEELLALARQMDPQNLRRRDADGNEYMLPPSELTSASAW